MPFTLTPEYLHTILDPMSKGDLAPFLGALDPEAQWTIVDPVYNPVTLTGTYVSLHHPPIYPRTISFSLSSLRLTPRKNLQTFQEKLGKPLFSRLTEPSSTIIDELDVIGLKAIVEASGFATQKNGKPCNNK